MSRADEGEGREPGQDDEARALIASLEKELGVTGTANVFRKALAVAKEAAAIARVRQETYAADQLVERLRSWGENDADPEFFTGDLLSGVLMDCGMGSEAIVAANLRAAKAEDEIAWLTTALAEAEASNAETLKLYRNCRDRLETSASALWERVATLEAALKPFAKLGTLFGPRTHESCDVLIYGPAAGAEYNLTGDHLRAARTALEAPHADN